MGLKMRITYKDTDYVYETVEIKIILNGQPVTLKNVNKVWAQDGELTIEPDFAQALGRSVSLRYRM